MCLSVKGGKVVVVVVVGGGAAWTQLQRLHGLTQPRAESSVIRKQPEHHYKINCEWDMGKFPSYPSV